MEPATDKMNSILLLHWPRSSIFSSDGGFWPLAWPMPFGAHALTASPASGTGGLQRVSTEAEVSDSGGGRKAARTHSSRASVGQAERLNPQPGSSVLRDAHCVRLCTPHIDVDSTTTLSSSSSSSSSSAATSSTVMPNSPPVALPQQSTQM
ncbi:hypothetical protein EYF80_017891 [Liparis tanakae]|uniref:Uncharacterized protein n=1 Tax=Liparis tanakae TaxID=230148 RepID=A0A4Z2I3J3_9TELE|nr:hypothetical protein EYF80_017891 [Liparis tanakae]